jgi:hypothetical protein
MDAVFGLPQQYYQKVLSYGPIAYWPLWEDAGVTAECLVNSPAQDGTYTGVTLGQPGIGDGNTCPLFDGVNDFVDIFSVPFRDAFNSGEGTLATWVRITNAAVWTDGTLDFWVDLRVDSNNEVRLIKVANNTVQWWYRAGAVVSSRTRGGESTTDWMHLALTWSVTSDEVRAYFGGVQEGATINGLGVWAGIFGTTLIGAQTAAPLLPANGLIAHPAVWDTPLSQPQIADLATV